MINSIKRILLSLFKEKYRYFLLDELPERRSWYCMYCYDLLLGDTDIYIRGGTVRKLEEELKEEDVFLGIDHIEDNKIEEALIVYEKGNQFTLGFCSIYCAKRFFEEYINEIEKKMIKRGMKYNKYPSFLGRSEVSRHNFWIYLIYSSILGILIFAWFMYVLNRWDMLNIWSSIILFILSLYIGIYSFYRLNGRKMFSRSIYIDNRETNKSDRQDSEGYEYCDKKN